MLIIHQNFPGQFRHVAKAWSERPGWKVVGIGRDTAPGMPELEKSGRLTLIRYKPHRPVHQEQHHYLRRMEDAVLHGQAVARILLALKAKGFKPDVILAHPGWGETLNAKDVFPDARLVHFCEWFYNVPAEGNGLDPDWQGADIGFDPEFPVTFDDRARIRAWNALHLLNLENCDAAISPTHWQKAQHPKPYLDKITVAHEGIDTENLGPNPRAAIKLPNGTVLRAGDPVITYVARNLEPYRGFHQFMRALPAIQKEHKTCHTVIVGGDGVSYGRKPEGAKHWRERMMREVGSKLDPTRTHFLGKVPYEGYKRVLQVSAAHIYLTYPFVLSWSLLEAMATGCLVSGSDTAPVREILEDRVNGRLVNAFDKGAVSAAALQCLLTLDDAAQDLRYEAQKTANARFAVQAGIRVFSQICFQSVLRPNVRRAA
ncbi:glycosyltransferase family 4 protein [Roseateles cellulosilyticus]|uniref:Glycosyltransferase family 4 protein n=1 Tax=Pelomonas cellulosilytica TaxID=2906762 RepID=A0ABS8XZY1_9BURK|nr:glycosyltransferase family 4 protein [Pelomonas sp. P8]